MRLLHTSDWHLGRTLHGYSLAAAQQAAVDAVVAAAIEHQADAVLISGDVFDRAVPPVESIRLFNSALERLADAGVAVIVIAGNHDSGDRLAMYAALLRPGVHIVGSVGDSAVPLEDEHGDVVVYAVPYLDPDSVRRDLAFGEEPLERSHEAVITAALDRVAADLAARGNPRAVAVAHAFVMDVRGDAVDPTSVASDSERDITVGGVQVVPAAVFADRGLSYVALGHLHRPQTVRAADPVMSYSGSLLRYSLSEAEHEKSFLIVDLDAAGSVSTQRVPIPQQRPMTRLTGTMAELLGAGGEPHREDFVELVVTDPVYPERMHARLDDVFPFALVKVHRPASQNEAARSMRGDARGREPLAVMSDFITKVAQREATPAELDLLRSTYESVRVVG